MTKNKYFPDISIKVENETETFSKVIAEPFERGYGVTIGNNLRRVLLTSIPGAAISSIKIDGVKHEFTTIEGVKEDVTEIILNLKKVRFKMLDDGPELVTLKLEGPGKITSNDISKLTSSYKVLDKKIHIATVTTKRKIEMELRISRGKGYSPAEKMREEENMNKK